MRSGTQGYFHASPTHPGQPYCIVIPHPITGSLHVGHALNNRCKTFSYAGDVCRGETPSGSGNGPCGIATQNVWRNSSWQKACQGSLSGENGSSERVWAWESSSGHHHPAAQRLGASCDWSRERFTMDDGLSKAVREVFVSLYKDKDKLLSEDRLINWCPRALLPCRH